MVLSNVDERLSNVDEPKMFTVKDALYNIWELCVPVMDNFIPASMVWDAITTKHDY